MKPPRFTLSALLVHIAIIALVAVTARIGMQLQGPPLLLIGLGVVNLLGIGLVFLLGGPAYTEVTVAAIVILGFLLVLCSMALEGMLQAAG